MTAITLVRHSISQANEDGINDSGRFNAPLSDRGQALAYMCAGDIEECPDAIYTSDLNRAAQTAEIFRDVLQAKFGREIPIITLEGLRGQDEGRLEGLHMLSPEFRFFSIMADKKGLEACDGESDQVAGARQLRAFLDVAENAQANGWNKALVFTHSDAIMRLQMEMRELPFPAKSPKHCQSTEPFDAEEVMTKIGWLRQKAHKPTRPKTPGIA